MTILKLLLPVLGAASVILAGPFSLARAASGVSPEEARESHKEMSGVLATPRLRQNLSAQLGQSKGVIQFTIRDQTGVG